MPRKADDRPPVELEVKVKKETAKAYLLSCEHGIGWMPKSQILESNVDKEGDEGVILIPAWLAEAKEDEWGEDEAPRRASSASSSARQGEGRARARKAQSAPTGALPPPLKGKELEEAIENARELIGMVQTKRGLRIVYRQITVWAHEQGLDKEARDGLLEECKKKAEGVPE